MKSESGPLKYRLARIYIGKLAAVPVYEYVLQGWFEITEYDYRPGELVVYFGGEPPAIRPLVSGEWRTLDTVDLED